MKCYICKKQISSAIRRFMPPKDNREKAQYRDICKICYPLQMKKEGYSLKNNVWIKE